MTPDGQKVELRRQVAWQEHVSRPRISWSDVPIREETLMAKQTNFGKNDGLGVTHEGSFANEAAISPKHSVGHHSRKTIKGSQRKAVQGARHSKGAKIR
jgi:hypothetical protein